MKNKIEEDHHYFCWECGEHIVRQYADGYTCTGTSENPHWTLMDNMGVGEVGLKNIESCKYIFERRRIDEYGECVICDKALLMVDKKLYQPHDGGEMQLIFSYGSTKFDLCPTSTVFRGLICDDCATKLVSKMKRFDNNND